jgi:hypothetical protein
MALARTKKTHWELSVSEGWLSRLPLIFFGYSTACEFRTFRTVADQRSRARIGASRDDAVSGSAGDAYTLNLSDAQLAGVKVEPAEEREFPLEKEAVGSIDFNEERRCRSSRPIRARSSLR